MAGLNCWAGYATDCIPHEGPLFEKFAQTTSLSDLNYSKNTSSTNNTSLCNIVTISLQTTVDPHEYHCSSRFALNGTDNDLNSQN